jgi:hypothetical protein
MRLSSLDDKELKEIIATTYDLVILASGYESRCQYVSSLLDVEKVRKKIILGFEFVGNKDLRENSNNYFNEKWGTLPTVVSSSNEMDIYSLLNSAVRDVNVWPKNILIDYSSMSRTWYAAILNWIRFSNFPHDVHVDFVYSIGSYSHCFSPIAVESILPLPGCEGSSGTSTASIAVFGLGFEGLAPLCVSDKLQPDEIFTYLACPAADKDYPAIAKKANEELMKCAKANLELPLSSVRITVSKLAEVISPYLKGTDITFVPMGPKPHVLAAILLAIRFEQVTCLHVNGKAHKPVDVVAGGVVIGTSVHFKLESA